MRRRDTFSPPGVGGSALLVIFAVLCLTVFALLGLATVQADMRLADASLGAVEDYYAADCRAQEILARLRAGLEVEGAELELHRAESSDGSRTAWSYAVPISDTQQLRVEVELFDQGYQVLRWQAVPVGDWTFSEDLELWDGLPF